VDEFELFDLDKDMWEQVRYLLMLVLLLVLVLLELVLLALLALSLLLRLLLPPPLLLLLLLTASRAPPHTEQHLRLGAQGADQAAARLAREALPLPGHRLQLTGAALAGTHARSTRLRNQKLCLRL